MERIMVPTAPAELIDKLTILRLKIENITDQEKLANVLHEQAALQATADAYLPQEVPLSALYEALYCINARLWQIEDDIRACEARQDFGPAFIELARAVYLNNDRRAEVKRQINTLLGSDLVEEKSYTDHGAQT